MKTLQELAAAGAPNIEPPCPECGMTRWQPIETAPKNGTEIILGMFRESFVDPIVMNSIWIDGEERGCYWSDWQGLPSPTHWMPLNPPIVLDAH